jgi:hypothetical protein
LSRHPSVLHTGQIINEFSLAFFDQYVKQKDDGSTLKRLITKYSEVNFKITLNVSFLVFHYLDNDEEIKFFNVINTRAKGNGTK